MTRVFDYPSSLARKLANLHGGGFLWHPGAASYQDKMHQHSVEKIGGRSNESWEPAERLALDDAIAALESFSP